MFVIALVIALLVAVVPVMIGARIVGARRTGFWHSLVALVVSYLIVAVAVRLLHGLGLLSIFVAALGYMAILDTSYLRALAVVIIQYVLAALFVVILAATLFGGVMHGVDRMLHDAPFRLDAPAQQV
jgi:hypothetical protein